MVSNSSGAGSDTKASRGSDRAPNAPVNVTVFRYGDRASAHVAAWPVGSRVFQLQMLHDGAPSYVVNIVQAFNAYLEDMHVDDSSMPKSLAELRQTWNIVLQITKASEGNVADVPLVNWRVAW